MTTSAKTLHVVHSLCIWSTNVLQMGLYKINVQWELRTRPVDGELHSERVISQQHLPLCSGLRRNDHVCLYCCLLTATDLGFGRPSVCCQVTRPLFLYPPSFHISPLVSWRFSPSHTVFFSSLFASTCVSLQCSPLLKVRRLIQKTGSAWRCVVSVLLFSQLIFLGAAALCQPSLRTLHPFTVFHFQRGPSTLPSLSSCPSL